MQQLLAAYDGSSIMALRRTREEDISHYGCATGNWMAKKGKLGAKEFLTVTALVEKPTAEYAQSNLTIPGYEEGDYLTAFGLYVVSENEKLLDILKEIRKEIRILKEIRLRQDYGLTGHVLQGERYDIGGAPTTYLDTRNAFAHSATSLAAGGQFAETPGAEPAQKRAKR